MLVDRFAGHGNNKVIGSAGADQLLQIRGQREPSSALIGLVLLADDMLPVNGQDGAPHGEYAVTDIFIFQTAHLTHTQAEPHGQ